MRRFIQVLVVVLCIVASLSLSAEHSPKTADLDRPYSPSRQEWLELSAFKVIKDTTDSWERRIAFAVSAVEKENTVFVTLTSANGQAPMAHAAQTLCIDIVTTRLQAMLDRWEWAKGMEIHVQFV